MAKPRDLQACSRVHHVADSFQRASTRAKENQNGSSIDRSGCKEVCWKEARRISRMCAQGDAKGPA